MFKTINRDELDRMISSGEKFKLVDVLAKDSFEKEHIRCSISLPLNEIEEKAGQEFRKDEAIVVYCASFECQASTMAAKKLAEMGFKNVYDYKGGIRDYKEGDISLEGSLYETTFHAASTCSCCL